jgi:hypothetical protein
LNSRLPYFEQWIVRLICAIALLFIGFAHQPLVIATDAGPIDLAEYALPDGTIPTLCLTFTDDKGQKHDMVHQHGCEACRISASAPSPLLADTRGEHVAFVTVAELPLRMEVIYRQLFPPNTGPRAPSSIPLIV